MATQWRSCVIATTDVPRLAAFWATAAGLQPAFETPDEVVLTAAGDVASYPGLVIVTGDR
jgi:hypothetical protein